MAFRRNNPGESIHPPSASGPAYRPDVDGLRAIAILAVLLFHAEVGLPGGFAGVDVFFVISGYLITRLLVQDYDRGSASLGKFWMRRIRRIAPAMTVMTLVVLVAGYVLLLPEDFMDLGRSVLANQALAANIYFWRSTGYFDGPANLKPLLHMWSLAVEEQFYLVYPLVFSFCWRRGRRWVLGIIAIGLATSFVVSVWGVRNYPGAAFFLMPSRAWELLAGAITFLIPTPRRLGRLPREVLAASGLGAIGYALWTYTQATPFPGVAALAPVGGTAALIWANTPTLTLVGRCLAMRPLVFLGLLSYSLYLWHWPILVFVRYCMPEHDAIAYVPGAVALAFVASYLSWRFVETPVRRAAVLADRALVGCWLSSILFLAGVGAFALVTNGAMHRFSPKTRELLTTMSQRRRLPAATTDAVKADRLIRLGSGQAQPTVALVGDSHANVLAGAVDEACSSLGLGCVAITHGGTLPLLGFRNSRQWAADEDWADTVLDYIVNRKFQVVILVGHWQRDGSDSALGDCLRRTVEALRKAGVRVIILADTPDHTTYTPQQLLRCLRSGIPVSSLVLDAADHERQVADSRAAIDAVLGPDVEVLDPAGALRDENGDFPVVVGDECMYFDSNHLTVAGARRLIPLFRKALESHSVAP